MSEEELEACWRAARDRRALLAEVDRLQALVLPQPGSGCVCPWHSEDRGGGYCETVAEYEPACPVHSTHLYDPRTFEWVER